MTSNEPGKNIVFSNFMWRFLERFGAQIVSLSVSVVLARIIVPEIYGTIALVTVITSILQVFVDSGLGNALIQKKNADDLDFSTVFLFNIFACCLLYSGLFNAAPYISEFYKDPSMTPVIRVVGLTLVISGLKNVQQAYVSRNMMFKKFFFATIWGTLISAAVGIFLAYSGAGVWAIAVQHLTNLSVDTLILWITVKWRPKLMFSWKRFKCLFSFGSKLLASALLDTVYNDLSNLIIGRKYTAQDLAFYNRGDQLPNMVVTNINTTIDSVLLPTLSASQDDPKCVKAMTRRAIKTGSFIMWPMMVGLAVCAEPLVRLFLTEKWLPCVPYLRIFCFSYALYPIHTSNLNAIKAMGRSDIFLRLEIEKKAIGICILAAAMRHGVLLIAYSSVVYCILSGFINSHPNKKLLGYTYAEQIQDVLPSVILALIMGIAVHSITFLHVSDGATLVIQILLGIAAYVGMSAVFKLDSFVYLCNYLSSLFKQKN